MVPSAAKHTMFLRGPALLIFDTPNVSRIIQTDAKRAVSIFCARAQRPTDECRASSIV
jgi:hypothetical protein